MPDLGFGRSFTDLYRREGLLRLDAAFLTFLGAADPNLSARLQAGRANPAALSRGDESTLLVALAPHLEDFLPRLFVRHHAGAAGHQPGGGRERLHHHPRPERLRQEHAAAHRRRPRPPDRRQGAARRSPHRRLRRRPRHGVPELHAVSVAHGVRQCLLRPARAGPATRRAARGRARLRRPRGAGPVRRSLSPPALRRDGQRVGIARAFVTDPQHLLMDEPLGSLDAQTRLLLQEELLRLWTRSKSSVVYATHDIEEAVLLGDRVLVQALQSWPQVLPHRLVRPKSDR